MNHDDQQPAAIPLDYQSGVREVLTSDVAGAYASRVTIGVGVGILVSASALLFLDPDGGPSSGICLFTSPLALLYTQLTGKAGGKFPAIQHATLRPRGMQISFIVGFLLPTENVLIGGLSERYEVVEGPVTGALAVVSLLSLLLGPFVTVGYLVQRSVSPRLGEPPDQTSQDEN